MLTVRKAGNEEHKKEKEAAELRKAKADGVAPWRLADVKPPKVRLRLNLKSQARYLCKDTCAISLLLRFQA